MLGGVGRRGRRQGKNLVKLAVDEPHGNLHSAEAVLMGEINRPLRVLEIKSVVGIGGPITQPAEIKPGASVLQQNLHRRTLVLAIFSSWLGLAKGTVARRFTNLTVH